MTRCSRKRLVWEKVTATIEVYLTKHVHNASPICPFTKDQVMEGSIHFCLTIGQTFVTLLKKAQEQIHDEIIDVICVGDG